MNFIFISPSFPKTYWNFCDRLKKRGVNVLGIGQDYYDSLRPELKNSLTEYYRVNNLQDYDQMLRAVGFFTFKYGHIDWLESNNEFWMDQDARLRTDFNITTGPKTDTIANYQNKALMKKFYAQAGVPTARYRILNSLEEAVSFATEVGYPLIVKPVKGVGANDTHRLSDEEALKDFYEHKGKVEYILEEFVQGDLISFDGIVNQSGQIIFSTNHVFPQQIMDVVNQGQSVSYWNNRVIPDDLFQIGTRVVKSFGIKGRFFHNEYFRLTQDKPGLGTKGTICGLEVNERPPGGYTPDMMDFSDNIDIYDIYAQMVTRNLYLEPKKDKEYFVVYVGRRDGGIYQHSPSDILLKYTKQLVWHDRMPEILAVAMGDEFFLARFKEEAEIQPYCRYIME